MDSNPNQISCLGHDGPLRHRLLQCGLHKQKRRLRRIGKQRGTGEGGGLLDLVRPLAVCSLGRVDPCSCLAPRMLTKPRTVCVCQPGAFMISARVAPLARFIIAISSACLLVRSPALFALLLTARLPFLRGFRFLGRPPGLGGLLRLRCRAVLGGRLRGCFDYVFHSCFSLTGPAVVTIHHSGWGETQGNSGD